MHVSAPCKLQGTGNNSAVKYDNLNVCEKPVHKSCKYKSGNFVNLIQQAQIVKLWASLWFEFPCKVLLQVNQPTLHSYIKNTHSLRPAHLSKPPRSILRCSSRSHGGEKSRWNQWWSCTWDPSCWTQCWSRHSSCKRRAL